MVIEYVPSGRELKLAVPSALLVVLISSSFRRIEEAFIFVPRERDATLKVTLPVGFTCVIFLVVVCAGAT